MWLDLPLVSNTWDDREAVVAFEVLRCGRTTMGRHVKKFEEGFAEYIGTKYAVMVNSGSSANLLMVAALVYSERLPRGSRVAVPATSWSTTYSPLEQFGMTLVVVDIDDTLTINPTLIPDDIEAVFGVNLLGNPCDWDMIAQGKYGRILLEDNCEGLGAQYNNTKTGNFGVMASHSLFFSHHIHTMEGGVITTNDDALYEMLLMLRAHGWTRDLPDYKPDTPNFKGYQFVVPGYNVRPTEVQGAIGNEQLRKLPMMVGQRILNGSVYNDLFGHIRENGQSSWHGFPLIIENRSRFLRNLDTLGDVETRPIVCGNILRQPMAKYLKLELDGNYPMANRIMECGLFFGNHHVDVGPALKRIAEVLAHTQAA